MIYDNNDTRINVHWFTIQTSFLLKVSNIKLLKYFSLNQMSNNFTFKQGTMFSERSSVGFGGL